MPKVVYEMTNGTISRERNCQCEDKADTDVRDSRKDVS